VMYAVRTQTPIIRLRLTSNARQDSPDNNSSDGEVTPVANIDDGMASIASKESLVIHDNIPFSPSLVPPPEGELPGDYELIDWNEHDEEQERDVLALSRTQTPIIRLGLTSNARQDSPDNNSSDGEVTPVANIDDEDESTGNVKASDSLLQKNTPSFDRKKDV
jgi:hypothetical protein